jgi:thiol-disulfide isomerase/thioredoxin
MLNVQIGPFSLPLNPLLMLAGWWLASFVADRMLRKQPDSLRRMGARALTLAIIGGLLAARAGLVAMAWPAYAAEPLSIFNVRDGGWLPWAGLAAAVGVLGGFAWRYVALRPALAAGTAAGFALWAAASSALGVHDKPPLPALTLATADGQKTELLARDGRPTVINLWASWCAPCRAEMPHLAEAQARHPDVRFVFVNHGEPPERVRAWLAQQPYRLINVLFDERQQLGPAMGTSGLPTTVFVDAQGQVVKRHTGPLSRASLEARLVRLQGTP